MNNDDNSKVFWGSTCSLRMLGGLMFSRPRHDLEFIVFSWGWLQPIKSPEPWEDLRSKKPCLRASSSGILEGIRVLGFQDLGLVGCLRLVIHQSSSYPPNSLCRWSFIRTPVELGWSKSAGLGLSVWRMDASELPHDMLEVASYGKRPWTCPIPTAISAS